MIGQEIQHYRIVRQLGAGGMGIVYEAEDTRLGRHVALKFLPEGHGLTEELVERFRREARIASSLNHPNICTIHDIGVHEGRHFIAMELLEGESLRSRIHGQPLPLDLLLDVGCQLADALDAAHAQGVVHRDIKPANVFLTRRGQAKLLDFGVAKLGEESRDADATAETRAANEALTTPGTAVGSVNYMSPEQARGEELDARTDLFSLGLVLYEMATGREAFEGRTTAVVFDAILNRQPPESRLMNPQVPEELHRVIARALEKDRRLRYQTAADMLAELGRLRRDTSGRTTVTPGTTAASGASPAAAQATVRRRIPIAMLAVFVVAAAGAAWYFGFRAPAAAPLTERDAVLIADFVNTTGDPVFDDALKQAVAVQLQQSPFVTLLPDLRVQRTLRLMQRPADEPVTGDVAREACQRAGARATVEGSIAPLGSAFVMNLGVYNCRSGAAIAQEQVQASSKEDVLSRLGAAVTSLRQRMGESLATIEKYDVPVTDATTRSLDALRAYGQGLRARSTRGDEAAIPFFKQAIDLDPQFALAYAKLGVVSFNTGRPTDAREYAKKAWELRNKVSEYERLYINWNYAVRVQQDQDKVRESLEILTAAYPRDFAARNNFGVYFNNRGELEEALKQYQAATDIAPDEPGPISNAAYVLLALGRFDDAAAAVDRALAIRQDGNLAVARWVAGRLNGSPRVAEFEQAARQFANEDQLAFAEASISAWEGRFADYNRIQDDLESRARAAGNEDLARGANLSAAVTRAIYLGGDALAELRTRAARETDPFLQAQYVSALAVYGDLGPARAALPKLEKSADADQALLGPVSVAKAYVLAGNGKFDEGISTLQATLAALPRARELEFMIADLRERAGQVDEAIEGYRHVIRIASFLGANPIVSVTRLKLARLLEARGDAAGAREQLDALLAQWKNADMEFPMLREARERRAKNRPE